jgi:regulator of protease activity HflC (stomatin/prohibitin superfamily)
MSGTDSGGTGSAVAALQAAGDVPIGEQPAPSLPGAVALPGALVLVGAGAAVLAFVPPLGAVILVAGALALSGLTAVAPGQARVVSLFGRYLGTVRINGLRWVNPFAKRQRVSTRIRNQETATLKVNDADGNPIEMAAVVVWQVSDTAKAVYAVEDVVAFVATQAETAVRHIAGIYPYDARGQERLSLRENAQEITSRLSAEIAERVAAAGVHVVESRITRLSYAPEIAQVMLRRQQAEAVVDARRRLVEGAVGMVRQALEQLTEEQLVDLDEERKAAMVSNLLVVLCSESATQPVVNTGTLYQ